MSLTPACIIFFCGHLVRVNLVDCEHPFFGRVWQAVHILDASSPLLTSSAREKIRQNHGEWPDHWLTSPERIRKKLDFQSLVVSVSGVSNVSASTVHAYKRYKTEGKLYMSYSYFACLKA